ncbi:putative aminotransferase, class I/classII, tyrosine/nicotianamine aminotransferase [Helianthus annuus]|nr:putative aminotransferase, class I/classII, tyrosine/nicotianamine aminotransferase [Helianthus annuus]
MEIETPTNVTIKGILGLLMANVGDDDKKKRLISLGMGDPTAFSCFTTTSVAQDAVVEMLTSHKFNGYSPTVGLPQTRSAICEYLSTNLPYKLSPDDVYITAGCTQAIEVAISILASPNANILVPRPGFPIYELCAAFRNVEIRHFDLLPENGWEVDLDAVDALADQNTVAIVIINPGNPCGNVYTYNHLKKIAETAKKHKIVVIADEVYGHLAFGANPFVPMGVFGSMVPVLTLGSLSKRWIVPGWRLGWFVMTDPNAIFKNAKTVERLKKYFDICGGPATFIQAAVPRILKETSEAFFTRTLNILKHTSDLCVNKIKDIPCLTCPTKPQGSMAMMVKLSIPLLKDIKDDIDFCFKLAKEESVILLPGRTVGLKNWVRITFAAEPSSLEEALERVKSFYHRHSYEQNGSVDP